MYGDTDIKAAPLNVGLNTHLNASRLARADRVRILDQLTKSEQ